MIAALHTLAPCHKFEVQRPLGKVFKTTEAKASTSVITPGLPLIMYAFFIVYVLLVPQPPQAPLLLLELLLHPSGTAEVVMGVLRVHHCTFALSVRN